ncbi:aminopeptidase [Pseudomonas aeruginosa]|nr:aminopeptidase [Pseudomonas aeruginosa]
MSNKNNLRYALGALALSVSAASLAAPSEAQQFTEFWTPGKPNPSICKSPLLVSTPLGLPRCLQASNVVKRLQKLEDIASLNDGNRAAATPGYQASVDYVKQTLQKAGYKVSVQPFPFTAYYPKGPGSLSATVPQPVTYEWEKDFTYLSQTEAGDVTAKVVPVDLSLGAGNTSTSGCEAEDFANFPAGSIALIQRGTCNFEQKAENAAAAGAAGVIIFNQGNTDDRKGLENVTVGESYEGGIPVIFATYDNGVAWSQTPDLQLHLVVDVVRKKTETYNVVAETRRGNPNNVVDGRRAPRLGVRRPRYQRQRFGQRRPTGDGRAAGQGAAGQQGALRLVGRRGSRPGGLDPLRAEPRPGREEEDQGLPELRHDRLAELRQLHL